MCEKYHVVNEFGETVGEVWFNCEKKIYEVSVASLGKDLAFGSLDSMEHYLWNLGLDAV